MLMLIISMVGNVVTKFFAPPKPPEEPKAQTRSKCSNCGRVVVGTAPCICGKG
jgi:Na+-transporting methylmalonyl-CoA/oxaloacetate decarboxylase gamma subunit